MIENLREYFDGRTDRVQKTTFVQNLATNKMFGYMKQVYCKSLANMSILPKTKEAFEKHTKVCAGKERIAFIPLKTEK